MKMTKKVLSVLLSVLLAPGGITVKHVYTPADICPLDNEYHGTSFWGRLVKFFHTVIWKAFNLLGMNIYLKIW